MNAERMTVGKLVAILSDLPNDWEVMSNDLTGSICLYRADEFVASVDTDTGDVDYSAEYLQRAGFTIGSVDLEKHRG